LIPWHIMQSMKENALVNWEEYIHEELYIHHIWTNKYCPWHYPCNTEFYSLVWNNIDNFHCIL